MGEVVYGHFGTSHQDAKIGVIDVEKFSHENGALAVCSDFSTHTYVDKNPRIKAFGILERTKKRFENHRDTKIDLPSYDAAVEELVEEMRLYIIGLEANPGHPETAKQIREKNEKMFRRRCYRILEGYFG